MSDKKDESGDDYYGHEDSFASITSTASPDGKLVYDDLGDQKYVGDKTKKKYGYCKAKKGLEKPVNEWNTLEIICFGNKSIHVLNDKVILMTNGLFVRKGETELPIRKGKIQIQTDGGEMYYKNIRIKSITKIPETIAKQIKE
ncbi:MAG: DUF1080 domain-containing protein [Saprospiraceae bacterium]|nr:DUF1080 domain-containing protein [Saprospiraceae bacterium]